MKTFKKQPNDHLDYDIDMSEWLSKEDNIQKVECTAPEGIEITRVGYTETTAKIWVKGGTSGQAYKLSPLIYTDSRTKEVDFMIVVEDM